jgi:type I restriction enzyme S subunit
MKAAAKPAQVPKLRFPGFEGQWPRQQLDAITSKKISYGIVQAGEHVPGGMPYIKSQDLNQPLDLDSLQRTSAEIARKYQRSEVEPGNIVFSLRGNIGLCQIVPASIPAANLTQGTARIAVADHDNRLVAQTLQTLDVVRQIEACAKGSTFREISLEALRKISIALAPTLPEQQKIAAFLTAVDGRIEQLSRKKALLEATKKGVMQQLFTQTLRFQDDHGHDFPDWEEKTLGDVARLYQPKTISQTDLTEEGYTVYGANGVIGKYHSYNHEQPQVIVTCRGSTCGVINYTEPRSWITGNAMVVNLDNHPAETKGFVYHLLCHADLRYLITGSGQPQITGNLKGHKINLPSLPEQTKIAGILSAMDGKIAAVGEQMRQTQAWKKGLLQQMFV